MRTRFSAAVLQTEQGAEMADILRACVHCGFCNATCPTYQLLGDELDGPRGRIYLIKSMLEDAPVGQRTQTHLDRCLSCRACETTCPSGVRYTRLLDLARPLIEQKESRSPWVTSKRWLIRRIVPYRRRFLGLAHLAAVVRPILPRSLGEFAPPLPARRIARAGVVTGQRRALLLDTCVQQALAPEIDIAAQTACEREGIALTSMAASGCCGAVSYHLGAVIEARRFARCNIDSWWEALDDGVEAIVASSTGCAMMLKEYPRLFVGDDVYSQRANRVADLVKDLSEILTPGAGQSSSPSTRCARVAFHAPCTMTHGLACASRVAPLLQAAGYELTSVNESHLCCGSAGSYSLLQPDLATQLLDRKLSALTGDAPDLIVTANIGCLMHLRRRAQVPVKHWLELLGAEQWHPGKDQPLN